MSSLFFRPNARISSLFDDLQMEGISIEDDTICETITDYHGNILVDKDTFLLGDRPSIDILKTLIASFDGVTEYIDFVPLDESYECLCSWFKTVLKKRGWLEIANRESKMVQGKEQFFFIKEDDAS